MTVEELIAALAKYPPDAEVIVTTQAHYPLEAQVAGVVSRRAALDADRAEDADAAHPDDPDDSVNAERQVLLVEGEHLGYGIRGAWRAVRCG